RSPSTPSSHRRYPRGTRTGSRAALSRRGASSGSPCWACTITHVGDLSRRFRQALSVSSHRQGISRISYRIIAAASICKQHLDLTCLAPSVPWRLVTLVTSRTFPATTVLASGEHVRGRMG